MKLMLAALALGFSACAHAQLNPGVLQKLNDTSKSFRNMTANVRYDNYTRVVRDHQIQTGSLFIERAGGRESMGAVFFDPGNNTPARVLSYDGGKLHMYTPGTNQDDVFAAGANQAKYESFLTLGFGGSGTDLEKSWNIQDNGQDTVNGVKAEKLTLTSKDPGVQNMFKQVTLWINLANGLSVRQIFVQPNGDTRTADYTDIHENTSINRKPYAIKHGAKVITH